MFSGEPLDVQPVSDSVCCCGIIVLALFSVAIWIWEMLHLPVYLGVQASTVCVSVRLCVCVPPQIAVSCEWTWLRRRYLGNDRNREWWFTGYFLHKAFFSCFHLTTPMGPKAKTRSQPLFTLKQRYSLRYYLPKSWHAAWDSLSSNIFNIK